LYEIQFKKDYNFLSR